MSLVVTEKVLKKYNLTGFYSNRFHFYLEN